MAQISAELQSYADDGLNLCRTGDWNKGLSVLAAVLEQKTPMDQVPGVVYSYLGYGVARFQGKTKDGLKLCEHALKVQYYEADNHWNLARIQVLTGERLAAFNTISKGLKLDPDHVGLNATQKEIGQRRPPILRFLGRSNPINVFLGRLRHGSSSSKSQPAASESAPSPTATGPAPRSAGAAGAAARSAAAPNATPFPKGPGARSTPAPNQAAKNPTAK